MTSTAPSTTSDGGKIRGSRFASLHQQWKRWLDGIARREIAIEVRDFDGAMLRWLRFDLGWQWAVAAGSLTLLRGQYVFSKASMSSL
ncbi:hypothetical protein RIF29_22248 [Crotalaria pallida]|uniref:Uncharacterized protein n=1 Tax=Crotalaria pallida TaxID=3830 RepID=A0AAN9F4A1_CROPI